MIIGIIGVGINIVLNLVLVRSLNKGGLALATSLAQTFSAGAQVWMLRKRIRAVSVSVGAQGVSAAPQAQSKPAGIGGRSILSSLWRVVVASGAMGAVVWLVYGWPQGRILGRGVKAQAVRLFGAVGVGILT